MNQCINKKIIAVIYAPPSIGRKGFLGINQSIDYVLKQVQIISKLGFDGVLIENEFDIPYTEKASPSDIVYLTLICEKVKKNFNHLEIGVEFLLNDIEASASIANGLGLNFIRSDYFVDEMIREDLNKKFSVDIKSYHKLLNSFSTPPLLLADIQVKYAKMIVPRPLVDSAKEAIQSGAKGVIISGDKTGELINIDALKQLSRLIDIENIWIGSGLDSKSIPKIIQFVGGALVGSSLMTDGIINEDKAKEVIDTWKTEIKKLA